jgi:hypothetical protein
MSHNPSYFSEPFIPREMAAGSIGPTIETFMDRPSIRKRRNKKPPGSGRRHPVQTVDGSRRWPSISHAAVALGVSVSSAAYAVRRGQAIAGVELIEAGATVEEARARAGAGKERAGR